ncbi:hypothetical protein LAV72_20140 [Lysinibacillus xylanilyticus]|uniref:hypothetical protein n=1 Tax=Lysinibacillus xylanilyticus TaxID=582475 RepID=UPI002B240B0B|nr:hypothetical protein [Lysinibacillus xylanilyticus]MEB2301922.1 hypothetical protein [Lysinibacillus xylanilyticus]
MGISDRGTKAKTITSCDNAFVTNILPLTLRFRAKKHPAADASLSRKKNILPLTLRFRAKKHPAADASLSRKKNILPLTLRFRAKKHPVAPTPPGSFALCENKAPGRNGNRPPLWR